jgi:drug/metabolite transporter (DMT)-like permease
MALYPLVLGLPLFVAGWFLISIPPLDAIFWMSTAAAIPIEALALLLYMEAIKVSPLSLTIPFLAFTPIFLLATGAAFLKEIPNIEGICGTLLIFGGSYVLNLNPLYKSLFYPFRAIAREKGSWLMLIVAFIYSITSVLGKAAVMHSSPVFFALTYLPTLTTVLLVLFTILGKVSWTHLRKRAPQGLGIGSLYLIEALFHSLALPLVKVAYLISIKRLAILISVLYGGVFFREKQIFYRLAGACLMVAGAVVISIWGR